MTPTSSSALAAPDQGPGSGVWTLGPWETGPPRARDDHNAVSTLSLHLQNGLEAADGDSGGKWPRSDQEDGTGEVDRVRGSREGPQLRSRIGVWFGCSELESL